MGEFCQLKHLSFAGWRENLASWFLVNLFADFNPDNREHNLLVNLGSRAGNSGKYRITIQEGEFDNPGRKVKFIVRKAESKQNHDQKENKKREAKIGLIVEALTKYPDGATARTLRAATNITSGGLMADLLEVLLVRRLIAEVEVKPTKGPSSTGYKLTGSKWVSPGSDPVEPTNEGLLGYRVSPLIGETQTQNPVGEWSPPSEAGGF